MSVCFLKFTGSSREGINSSVVQLQDHTLRIMADEELNKLAAAELLLEAGRGKERASTMGTYGWKKRQVSTNKVFLKNTLRGMISGNRHQSGTRVEKRHKDNLKRIHVGTNASQEDKFKSHKLCRKQHHHRLDRTSEERDKGTSGHSSVRDDRDFQCGESCSQRNSRSSGTCTQNHRYHRTISHEDALHLHSNRKEGKRTSGKSSSTK